MKFGRNFKGEIEIDLTKTAKYLWTILVTYLMMSTSVPFALADMDLTSCSSIRPSKVMYCSMPLEIVERSEDLICCGDGTTFDWEEGDTCSSDAQYSYGASYCSANEDEGIDDFESCRRQCSSKSYTESDYDISTKSCSCQTSQEGDDYQYFFYVDKNSKDDIKLILKDVSQVKRMDFIENLLPGSTAKLERGKTIMKISDNSSFILHGIIEGNKKRLEIKKHDSFIEPIDIIPVEQCDMLVAHVLSTSSKITGDYADTISPIKSEYIHFENRALGAIYESLIRPDSNAPGIIEEASSVAVYRVVDKSSNVNKAIKVIDGVEFELIGTYSSRDLAMNAMRLNENTPNPWVSNLESIAFELEDGSGRIAAILDLNAVAIRTDSSAGIKEYVETVVKSETRRFFKDLPEPDMLEFRGKTIHTHPRDIELPEGTKITLTPSKADVLLTSNRFHKTVDSLTEGDKGFNEILIKMGLEPDLENSAAEWVSKYPLAVETIMDPHTGEYKMTFMDIDSLKKETWRRDFFVNEVNKMLEGGEITTARKTEMIDNYYHDIPVKEDVFKFEVVIGENPNTEEISKVLKIMDVRKQMELLDFEFRLAEDNLKMFESVKRNLQKVSEREIEVTPDQWKKIQAYAIERKTNLEVSKRRLEVIKSTSDAEILEVITDYSNRVKVYYSVIEKEWDELANSETVLDLSKGAADFSLPDENIESINRYMLEWEEYFYDNFAANQRDIEDIVTTLKSMGIINEPEIEAKIRTAFDDLKTTSDAVIELENNQFTRKHYISLANARNSRFTKALRKIAEYSEKTTSFGDVLTTAGFLTADYAKYVDNVALLKFSSAMKTIGISLELINLGLPLTLAAIENISLSVAISQMVNVGLFTGMFNGMIIGVLVSLAVMSVANILFCINSPESPYCGCSVNPYYGKNPIIEFEKTRAEPGEPINYIVYGMQYCNPTKSFGIESSMYNLFAYKKGTLTEFVGTHESKCNFEDGVCCEGSVSFDLEPGEYDIAGFVTWNPQGGAEATTESTTIRIGSYDDLYSIGVEPGWQMISAPYESVEFDMSNCELAQQALHYTDDNYQEIDTDDMEGGVAYWVYSYNTCQILLVNPSGAINSPDDLNAGQNQIVVPVSGMNENKIACNMVQRPKTWNSETGRWVYVDRMEPGKSYFVDCE